jgi:ubiquitin carboxyl-terminal hydrolase 1
VLALHLNRSAFFGHYASKNPCSVTFPELLDITPFTTSGALSVAPQSPLSKPAGPLPARSSTPTPSVYSTPRTLYRLSAVVCHYGSHSFGHYVAYRRKPRDPSLSSSRWGPPKLRCPYGCECERCAEFGPVRDSELFPEAGLSRKGKERAWESRDGGWLRISDDSVREVGIDTVLSEKTGSFMLFYERVLPFQSESLRTSPRSSQETVTPHQEERKLKPEEEIKLEQLMTLNARIIRSVAVGNKSREGSVNFGEGSELGDSIHKHAKHANGHSDPFQIKADHDTNGTILPPQNGSADPSSPTSTHVSSLSPKSHSTSIPLSPASSSPSRGMHHRPRNPSPVRTVNLMA